MGYIDKFNHQWIECRPVAPRLTAEEREEWQKEYCASWKWIDPTQTTNGHFLIIDGDGRETRDRDFVKGMETAIAKWKAENE